MTALQIPCPKCGATLKLKDRSLLGRTGKCPKCGHRFVMNEPDEIELELVPSVEEPVVVANVRRVAEPAATPSNPAPAVPVPPAAAAPAFAFADDTPAAAKPRPVTLTRRPARYRKTQTVLGGLLALAVGGVIWVAINFSEPAPVPVVPPQRNAAYESEKAGLRNAATLIGAESPTHGEPITLRYVPAGASVVVHLRPAELWRKGSRGEEVVFGLGPFGTWVGQRIEEYAFAPPAEVEEMTFAVLLGARGTPPEVATVTRYTTGRSRSELLKKFGTPTKHEGVDVYLRAETAETPAVPARAFMFGEETDDARRPLVVASAPPSLASDLAESFKRPGLASDAVTQLLKKTDRDRHLTILFQPADLQVHADALADPSLLPAWGQVLDRFGDAEAACWSVHLADDEFVSDLLVRTDTAATPGDVLRQLRGRLDAAPEDLLAAVSKMNPVEVGPRKLIGRFPAMAQVFAAATVGGIDDRLAVLRTRGPERAAPNLTAAGLLAWHESMRTDFTKSAAPAGTGAPSDEPPKTLAERLKKPIEVDFRKTPLESAFASLGEETKVTFEVDGEALKFAGYTKNMEQNHRLGTVPAEKAVAAILMQYDKMCVVLDEKNDKAMVTTFVAAEAAGRKPTTFAP